MTRQVLVALVVLLAAPVAAQEPQEPSRLFRTLGTTYTIIDAVDIAQTAYMQGTGRFYELNPVLRPIADQPAWLALSKAGTALALNWITERVYPRHPRLALVVRVFLVASYGATVVWNIRKMHAGTWREYQR